MATEFRLVLDDGLVSLFDADDQFSMPIAEESVLADEGGKYDFAVARLINAVTFGEVEKLHSCDVCQEEFIEDEMFDLGGDREYAGSLMAFPAVCNDCNDKRNLERP